MDNFIFDFNYNIENNLNKNPSLGPNGECIFSDPVFAQQGLSIGSGNTSYSFPLLPGPASYVLASNGTNLGWAKNGDIYNGGNDVGPILIKTKNDTDITITSTNKLNLNSDNDINIGSAITPNQIFLHGSVGYQYNNINTSLGTLNLDANYYFVEITNAGTNIIQLPSVVSSVGRHYIISKGYISTVSSELTIKPAILDTIDGLDVIVLTEDDQKIQIMSNGINRWIIL
jgi:hypothetical protein